MNVQQLMQALAQLPPTATVLIEGESGYSPLGSLELVTSTLSQPDEVLLQADLTPD